MPSYLFLTLKGDGKHRIHYLTDFLKIEKCGNLKNRDSSTAQNV